MWVGGLVRVGVWVCVRFVGAACGDCCAWTRAPHWVRVCPTLLCVRFSPVPVCVSQCGMCEPVGGAFQPRSSNPPCTAQVAEVRRLSQYLLMLGFWDPELAAHLCDHGLDPELYVIPWMESLFSDSVSMSEALRVWDLLLVLDARFVPFLCVASVCQVCPEAEVDSWTQLPCRVNPSSLALRAGLPCTACVHDWCCVALQARARFLSAKDFSEQLMVLMSLKTPARGSSNLDNVMSVLETALLGFTWHHMPGLKGLCSFGFAGKPCTCGFGLLKAWA